MGTLGPENSVSIEPPLLRSPPRHAPLPLGSPLLLQEVVPVQRGHQHARVRLVRHRGPTVAVQDVQRRVPILIAGIVLTIFVGAGPVVLDLVQRLC